MTAGTGTGRRPGRAGYASNNWLPIAALGVLLLGGAVAAVATGDDTGRLAAYVVVGTLALVLVTVPWLLRHPPALHASTGTYLVLAVAVELGALLGGAVEAFRGLGAWAVLGLGLAVYGYLERARVVVTAGVVAVLLGIAAIAADRPWLTLFLASATAAMILLAARRLKRLADRRDGAEQAAP